MDAEQQVIGVELDGTPAWESKQVDDARVALSLVLAAFDRSGRSAFAHLGRRSPDGEPDGALLIRCPSRRVLVIGQTTLAERIRQLLIATAADWSLYELPQQRTDLEKARPILGDRTTNMLIRHRYRTVEELAATPDRALRGLRNLGPKALATIHRAVTALYTGSLTAPGSVHAPTPPPGSGPAPTAQLASFTTGQLLTLLAACVHELRHRGVTPTIDDIPDRPAGDIDST